MRLGKLKGDGGSSSYPKKMSEEDKLREAVKLLFTTVFDPPVYDPETDELYIEDDCYRRLVLNELPGEVQDYIEGLFE